MRNHEGDIKMRWYSLQNNLEIQGVIKCIVGYILANVVYNEGISFIMYTGWCCCSSDWNRIPSTPSSDMPLFLDDQEGQPI